MEEYSNINSKNRSLDSIMGFIVGDALGVPAEFKSRVQLKRYPVTDMVGYGTHNMPEGTWSDDTSMTLAAVDSINDKHSVDFDDIMIKFAEWFGQSKYTATGVFFDIGISTSSAIRRYLSGLPATKCGGNNVRDNGNGSLMRILPFVLYSYYQQLDRNSESTLIDNASSLTHAHEISKLGCRIYCDYIKAILDGQNKVEAFNNLKMIDYYKEYSNDSIKYYQRILDGSLINEPEEKIKSSGFVVDSLEASIWCVLNNNNYKDTVLKAVNLGEDTDTIGAITGSMAGLLYGYENIPKEWLAKIKSRTYAEELCNKFNEVIKEKSLNK